jgi:hypothetical protein
VLLSYGVTAPKNRNVTTEIREIKTDVILNSLFSVPSLLCSYSINGLNEGRSFSVMVKRDDDPMISFTIRIKLIAPVKRNKVLVDEKISVRKPKKITARRRLQFRTNACLLRNFRNNTKSIPNSSPPQKLPFGLSSNVLGIHEASYYLHLCQFGK